MRSATGCGLDQPYIGTYREGHILKKSLLKWAEPGNRIFYPEGMQSSKKLFAENVLLSHQSIRPRRDARLWRCASSVLGCLVLVCEIVNGAKAANQISFFKLAIRIKTLCKCLAQYPTEHKSTTLMKSDHSIIWTNSDHVHKYNK